MYLDAQKNTKQTTMIKRTPVVQKSPANCFVHEEAHDESKLLSTPILPAEPDAKKTKCCEATSAMKTTTVKTTAVKPDSVKPDARTTAAVRPPRLWRQRL